MKHLLLLLLFPLHLSAQPCKLAKDEVDKFTKERHMVTQNVDLAGGLLSSFLISFERYGPLWAVGITYIGRDGATMVARPENGLTLLFENDTTLTIYPMQTYFGSNFAGTGYFEAKYLADVNFVEYLASNPIQAVRFTHSGGVLDRDTKPKWRKKIQAAANCILNP